MDFTIEQLSVADMQVLSEQLAKKHHDEVPFGSGKHEMSPDWGNYFALEDGGYLLTLGAFNKESSLVGYIVVITTPMLHHVGKFLAFTDSFYVHPKCRKQGVFEALLAKANEHCRGAAEIVALRVGVNQNFPLDPEMLNKLGYAHAETIYQQEF